MSVALAARRPSCRARLIRQEVMHDRVYQGRAATLKLEHTIAAPGSKYLVEQAVVSVSRTTDT